MINIEAIRPSNFYSAKEVCEMLGIHRNTLRNHTLAGIIKPRVSKRTERKTYSGKELLRYINFKH